MLQRKHRTGGFGLALALAAGMLVGMPDHLEAAGGQQDHQIHTAQAPEAAAAKTVAKSKTTLLKIEGMT